MPLPNADFFPLLSHILTQFLALSFTLDEWLDFDGVLLVEHAVGGGLLHVASAGAEQEALRRATKADRSLIVSVHVQWWQNLVCGQFLNVILIVLKVQEETWDLWIVHK